MAKLTRFYIDFNNNRVCNEQLGVIGSWPTIAFGAEPVWEIHFLANDGTPDMSDAMSWHAAIDTDFLSGTTPMCRTFDDGIDHSRSASGVIAVSLNSNTEEFFAKVDGKDTVNAWFELRGNDGEDKAIYVFRVPCRCLGAVDAFGGEPLPVISGGVTQDTVYNIVNTTLSGVSNDFAALSASVDSSISNLSGSVDDAINELSSKFDIVIEDIAEISGYPAMMNALSTQVEGYSGRITACEEAIEGLALGLSGVSDDVDTLSGAVVANTAAIAATASSLSGYQTRSTVYAIGNINGDFMYDLSNGDIQTATLTMHSTLVGMTNFSSGDCAALIVNVPTSGFTLDYGQSRIIDTTEQGKFQVGIIALDSSSFMLSKGVLF